MTETGPPVARPLRVLGLLAGVAILWAASRWSVSVPGSPVPITAQSLAVLCVGLVLGPGQGSGAVAAYLLLGALGLPVLAEGKAGLAAFTGPTGGFLLGFLPAAAIAGSVVRRSAGHGLVRSFAWLLSAHAVILACGWLRLSWRLGALPAFERGVLPFLPGALLKSVLAALFAWGLATWQKKSAQ